MTQEFSATLSGVDGDFTITEEGSHQEAGHIRRYGDNKCHFYYYYKINFGDECIECISVTYATFKKLGGGAPIIPQAHLTTVKNNIQQSFYDRSVMRIREISNQEKSFPVFFEWNL